MTVAAERIYGWSLTAHPDSRYYHVPDRSKRGAYAQAICCKGIAATSARPPLGYVPCATCFGRVTK